MVKLTPLPKDKFKVNEVFCSIQGEGPSVGHSAVFVRFSGCTLNCEFCDTDHEEYELMDIDRLCADIRKEVAEELRPGCRVILTGGEPLMQITPSLIHTLKEDGFRVCIETSASTLNFLYMDILNICDEVVVSPKDIARVHMGIIERATCVKILAPNKFTEDQVTLFGRLAGQARDVKGELVLQPVTPHKPEENMEHWKSNCSSASFLAWRLLTIHNQVWRVIPQTHVFMGIK